MDISKDSGILHGIKTIKKFIDKTIDLILIVLMVALVMIVAIQVFTRYILNSPTVWTEELSRYVFVWIVFLATFIAFKEDRHMNIGYFVGLMPKKVQQHLAVIVYFLIMTFLLVVITIAPQIIKITMSQISPTMSLPLAVIYTAFPVSAVLMVLEIIFKFLINVVFKDKRGEMA